jgi:hypothetical protein
MLKEIAKERIEAYLQLVSKDLTGTRDLLVELKDRRLSIDNEFYEQSPLKRCPLLRIDDRFYCYSPTLLIQGISSYIYDLLRRVNPEFFMSKFGGIYEAYVERGIEYAGLEYLPERKLARILGSRSKVVDFLIVDGGANILVESKGVEMPPIGMLTHLQDVVRDRTKSSIMKAIIQAYDAWSVLKDHERVDSLKLGNGTPYLMVVTYKDLYIGNGTDFFRDIAPEFLTELMSHYDVKALIPPEQMYFISADDFDFMVQAIHSGTPLAHILAEATKVDTDPHTKKFVFRDHIQRLAPGAGIPDFLNREFESTMDKIRRLLPSVAETDSRTSTAT